MFHIGFSFIQPGMRIIRVNVPIKHRYPLSTLPFLRSDYKKKKIFIILLGLNLLICLLLHTSKRGAPLNVSFSMFKSSFCVSFNTYCKIKRFVFRLLHIYNLELGCGK